MPDSRPATHRAANTSNSSSERPPVRNAPFSAVASRPSSPSTGTDGGQTAGKSCASGPSTFSATRRSAPAYNPGGIAKVGPPAIASAKASPSTPANSPASCGWP